MEVPPYDFVSQKMIGEMSPLERLDFHYRIRAKAIMDWDCSPAVKRAQILELERITDAQKQELCPENKENRVDMNQLE